MKRFWVYFRGTSNGLHIHATSHHFAKLTFMRVNSLHSIAYIASRLA